MVEHDRGEDGPLGPFDLEISRVVDVPRELVWRAWTTPEHLVKWFTPDPWKTVDCRIDLRPGGEFYTLMRGPDGTEHGNSGCFLQIVPHERLVFTDTMLPGWRPSPEPFMTAIVTMRDHEGGTRYVARALHKNDADRVKHEEMGFHQGWNTALDQLVALVRTMKA